MSSAAAVDPDLVRHLFTTPPPEFVAARNALAKQLRAAKNRDAADAVSGWRRPGWADWALDVTAGDHPDAVAAYATAAADVRAAQAAAVEGRDGPDVRDALRALRDAVARLARHAADVLAGAGRDADVAEVTARLAEVAANPAAVEQLRDGMLGAGDPDAGDLFAGLRPAARPRRGATRAAPASATDDAATGDAGTAADDAREAAAERAERRRVLERELEEAEEQRRAAAGDLGDIDAELETAEAAVRDAADALARAETHRDDVGARRAAAADALAAADAAADARRDAVTSHTGTG